MTAAPQIFRVLGHARTLKCTGRSGRQHMYRATCECGWQDIRSRAGIRIAKDFHVAHLQGAGRREPKRVMADANRPMISVRKMPEVGEVWTMTSRSAEARTIDAVDQPYIKQRCAYIILRSIKDPRVTYRITMASFLSRYVFTSSTHELTRTTAAYEAATCSGATC
jgi:hypothetical protein